MNPFGSPTIAERIEKIVSTNTSIIENKIEPSKLGAVEASPSPPKGLWFSVKRLPRVSTRDGAHADVLVSVVFRLVDPRGHSQTPVPAGPPASRPVQASPALQVRAPAEPQHGWPLAPQASQVVDPPPPFRQMRPTEEQVAPPGPAAEQQGWPSCPQARHSRLPAPASVGAQARPLSHVPAAPPPQQRWPAAPQSSQVGLPPPVQSVPAAVQVSPAQQTSPVPPQARQVPRFAPPAPSHAVPAAVQVRPPPAVPEEQHGSFKEPHAIHTPGEASPAPQVTFAAVQVLVPPVRVQQDSPAVPQVPPSDTHAPAEQ